MFKPKLGPDKSSEDLSDSSDYKKIEYEEYQYLELEEVP